MFPKNPLVNDLAGFVWTKPRYYLFSVSGSPAKCHRAAHTLASCPLHHTSVNQGWELCSWIAEAIFNVSHPILAKPASRVLSFCPSQMKYNTWLNGEQAVPSSACSWALQLSSSWRASASLKLCSCHYFHPARPMRVYSKIYFISAENIYTKTWVISLKVSEQLSIHLQGKWPYAVSRCRSLVIHM